MNAVLFLDLDRFKLVNDSLGHLAGDQLLVRVARTLEACLRPGDIVARLGGDEFTILLEDLHEVDDAVAVAERIHEELSDAFHVDDEEVFTTASIGIALSATGLEKAEDLLRDADTAMYRAKAEGAGRHQLFDQDMRRRAVRQLKVETELRHAIEREQFVLHYQPIISVSGQDIVGFEALVRWQHPERGLMGPYDFIPAAEETGLIFPLGNWILREACEQMKRWHGDFPQASVLTISVNLSPKQFNHPKLLHQVQETLESTQLEPSALQLEITESAFIDNVDAAIEVLAALRKIGVAVAIDDFGTGYSSLSYLNRFPVDLLKIDRSFIRRMGPHGKQNELVKTIIQMAGNLDIKVIAEGVETEEQRHHLKKLACGYLQGFSFSHPIPATEIRDVYLNPRVPLSPETSG